MNISVLGSTGSIGTQTLELCRLDREIKVNALAAHSNVKLIFEQIKEFKPRLACLYNEESADKLKKLVEEDGTCGDITILSGMDGLIRCAEAEEADTVVVSVVGMIGIKPTIAAIKAHKKIALANKETLVCAGHIIMPMIEKYGVSLMPVDSEHSAIYQCFIGEERGSFEKILLTASGGPFRGKTLRELENIKPEDALKHPNWSMGAKITIDSSTMINKALEVIEAHYLFDVDIDDIQVVIQPQSIIHSMVQFKDGAVKAQLGVPSMLIPIEYALYAPNRISLPPEEKLDFTKLKEISFSVPDLEVFKGLKLGIEAGRRAGNMTTVFNAANEEAVAAFLAGKLSYLGITDSIEACMESISFIESPSVEEILNTEKEARNFVKKYCETYLK